MVFVSANIDAISGEEERTASVLKRDKGIWDRILSVSHLAQDPLELRETTTSRFMQPNQTNRSRSRTPPSRRKNRRRSRTPATRQLTPTQEPHAQSGNIFNKIRRRRTTGHCMTRCGGVAGVYALIDVWLMRHRNFAGSVLTPLHQAPLVDRYAVVMGGPITGRRQDEILRVRLAQASGFRTNPHLLPAHTRWEHETFKEAFVQHLSLGPGEHRRERYRCLLCCGNFW